MNKLNKHVAKQGKH